MREVLATGASVLEREFECNEQRFGFVVAFRGGRDADIQTTQCVNFVILDLGEDDLLFHTDVVMVLFSFNKLEDFTEISTFIPQSP